MKKERRDQDSSSDPARGTSEQYSARRSLSGAWVTVLPLKFQEPCGSSWRFRRKQNFDAHASRIVRRPRRGHLLWLMLRTRLESLRRSTSAARYLTWWMEAGKPA